MWARLAALKCGLWLTWATQLLQGATFPDTSDSSCRAADKRPSLLQVAKDDMPSLLQVAADDDTSTWGLFKAWYSAYASSGPDQMEASGSSDTRQAAVEADESETRLHQSGVTAVVAEKSSRDDAVADHVRSYSEKQTSDLEAKRVGSNGKVESSKNDTLIGHLQNEGKDVNASKHVHHADNEATVAHAGTGLNLVTLDFNLRNATQASLTDDVIKYRNRSDRPANHDGLPFQNETSDSEAIKATINVDNESMDGHGTARFNSSKLVGHLQNEISDVNASKGLHHTISEATGSHTGTGFSVVALDVNLPNATQRSLTDDVVKYYSRSDTLASDDDLHLGNETSDSEGIHSMGNIDGETIVPHGIASFNSSKQVGMNQLLGQRSLADGVIKYYSSNETQRSSNDTLAFLGASETRNRVIGEITHGQINASFAVKHVVLNDEAMQFQKEADTTTETTNSSNTGTVQRETNLNLGDRDASLINITLNNSGHVSKAQVDKDRENASAIVNASNNISLNETLEDNRGDTSVSPASQKSAECGAAEKVGSVERLPKAWYGGVLASNGRIYGIPYNAPQVLEFDPVGQTLATFGDLGRGPLKYKAGIIGPNGLIYAVPYHAVSILEIDPLKQSVYTFGSLGAEGFKYGAAVTTNERIYGIPYNANNILEISPLQQTVETFAQEVLSKMEPKIARFEAGVADSSGRIYCIPGGATAVLEIQPLSRTANLIGALKEGVGKYSVGVLAGNGKIYGIPYKAEAVLEIDPTTSTVSTFADVGDGCSKFRSVVLGQNGRIYGIPYSANGVLEIDPEARLAVTFGSLPPGAGKFMGGVIGKNGHIFGIPFNSASVLEIDPETRGLVTFGDFGDGIVGAPVDVSSGDTMQGPPLRKDKAFKFIGGLVGQDGNIYGIPHNAEAVLRVGFGPCTQTANPAPVITEGR